MSVEIRPYDGGDESGVLDLWREAFPNPKPHNDPGSSIRRKLDVQRDLFFVAVDGDEVVGTAMAGYDGHRGWVYSVATSSARRREGVGRALMERVEAELVERGCPKLNLQVDETNSGVVAFYDALGYRVEPRISMGKVLAPGKPGRER